ncbi:Uncharacterized protein Adt_01338 [Abeliophyllum distichum]|uniref:Uncharacterized protein n=1 Tax=Abeliophyllum distichum TaxID=126358 RepID=A0ABD1VSK4_9LAMI
MKIFSEIRSIPSNEIQPNALSLSSSCSSDVMSVVCPSFVHANTLFFRSAYNVQVIVDEKEPEEKLLGQVRMGGPEGRRHSGMQAPSLLREQAGREEAQIPRGCQAQSSQVRPAPPLKPLKLELSAN